MKTVKKNRSAHRSTVGEIPGAATYGREEMRQKPKHGESGGLAEGFARLGADAEPEQGSQV